MLLAAQQETVEYGVDSSYVPKMRFVDEYDYVFMTREKTTNLIKFNIARIGERPPLVRSNERLSSFIGISGGFEFKLSPEVSLNTNIIYRFVDRRSFGLTRIDTTGGTFTFILGSPRWYVQSLNFDVEPRWYFNMKRRIEDQLSENNLTGNYLSMKVGINNRFNRFETSNTIKNEFSSDFSIGPRLGLQRRVFRRFYVDAAVGFDYLFGNGPAFKEDNIENEDDLFEFKNISSFQFTTSLTFGLAWGKTSANYNPNTCDALKCFVEENRIWKVDLINLAQIANQRFTGNVNIAYEQKLWKSPWSVTPEFNFNYDAKFFDSDGRSSNSSMWLRVGLKNYYNLKKRIAKGKSANNLSGDFWGLYFTQRRFEQLFSGFSNPSIPTYVTFSPVWGLQRRLFKNAFFEFSLGPSFQIWTQDRSQTGTLDLDGISQLKIGIVL